MQACKYSSKRIRAKYALMMLRALTAETRCNYQTATRLNKATQVEKSDLAATMDRTTMVDMPTSAPLSTINEVSMAYEENPDDWFNQFWSRKRNNYEHLATRSGT